MDVVGYLFLSLLGAGYMVNDNSNDGVPSTKSRKINKDAQIPRVCKLNNDKKTQIIEGFACPDVMSDTQLPQEFGSYVTPYFYNTLQLTGATNKIPNSSFDQSLILQGISPDIKSQLMAFNGKLKAQSLSDNSQLPRKMDPDNTINWDFETIQPPSKYESLPHDETHLDETVMTHTNMVPFYKGNITQNMDPENRLNAHKLELYTGNYKLRKHNKEEVEPFFAPTTGLTNIYGSVERREMDRYKPSNTGKKNNELPFNQVHVGPGLNQGFTAAPSGGFHDFTRIMPKTGDEQYVNAKSESKGKINHGKAPTERRTMNIVQYKYKPSLLVENKCGERNFTTTGQVQGRKLRPNVVVRDTNRKHHIEVMGHATPGATAMNRPENLFAKVQKSRNTNYKNTPYRNAVLAEGKKINDFGKTGYENKPNERTVTGTRNYWSNLTAFVKQIVSQFTDTAKYTRKQEYILSPRPYGNLQAQQASNLPAYNPNDVAKTTIRETTEAMNRMGITKQLGAGKSKAYDASDVAKTTIKQTTEDLTHVGITKQLGAGKGKAYDANDMAKTTIRQTTEDLKRVGITKQLGAGKGKAYDASDVAKTTIRQTIENFNHLGQTKQLGAGKSIAYDPNDVAKTTIRQTTENFKHVGISKQLGAGKSKAYDPSDVAKTTIRQTTENFNRVGQTKKLGAGKSKAYDPDDVAKTTIRQTTENFNHVGITKQLGAGQSKAYDPNDIAKTTIRQTTEDFNHVGITKQLGAGQSKAYDPSDVAKTTIRQTTEDLNHVGISKQIGAGSAKAYDPSDVAKTTVKETTENLNRKGIVSNALQKKHIAYDPTEVAKTTIKETTENLNRKGIVSNAIQKKHIAYDPSDVAKTTIKETTEDVDRQGNVSGGQFQNGDGYKVTNAYANNTNRQFTQDYYWAPAANAVTKKNAMLYDDAYNAQVNVNKELIALGREPTKESVKLTNPLNNMTNYEVKKIDGDSINWRGAIKTSNVGDYFNANSVTKCTTTSIKNNLPEDYTRLDTTILEAYKRNPLTQSLQSYA